MAIPTTRQELKEYCLRALGFPVIEINVDDTQLEDRLDESVQYWQEWHMEGTQKLFMKHKLTGSVMTFTNPVPPGTFHQGDLIYNQTHTTVATVWHQNPDNQSIIYYRNTAPDSTGFVSFQVGDSAYSPTGVQLSDPITSLVLGDMDNRYIPVTSDIMSVARIFPIQMNSSSTNYLFDGQYYTMLDVMYNFNSVDMVTYEMTKEQINLINKLLVGEKPIRFNRYDEKLYIDFDWIRFVQPDIYVIIECYKVMNPANTPNVWNDYFLKQYTTCLFKIQWAQNLSKFANIQLLGGVTLDGVRMLEQALAEKVALEEKMMKQFSMPMGIYIG